MVRTDLAWEATELWQEQGGKGLPEGVSGKTEEIDGCRLETLRIESKEGEAALGKPAGRYLTLFPKPFLEREEDGFRRCAMLLGQLLRTMLPREGGVLVVGLGNRAITPDDLGPRTLRHVLATRHLPDALPEFRVLRKVSTLTTDVLGNTGIESSELVTAAVERLQPAAVVAVDALASRRLSRVCRTVQLTDTGIIPGSGVGNSRKALNRALLGVPVLVLGVPTVVDGGTLAADLTAEAGLGCPSPGDFGDPGRQMIVTPREIDRQIADLSRLLGYALNLALQDLSVEDITALIE